MNIYCISSATEHIIMEVPQKIPIYTFSVALAYNGTFIVILLKAPDLEYIFRGTLLTRRAGPGILLYKQGGRNQP